MKRRRFIKITGMVLAFAVVFKRLYNTSYDSAKSIYRNIRYGTITKEFFILPYEGNRIDYYNSDWVKKMGFYDVKRLRFVSPPCSFEMYVPKDFKSLIKATVSFLDNKSNCVDKINVGRNLGSMAAEDYVGYTFNSDVDIRVLGLRIKYQAWDFRNGRT